MNYTLILLLIHVLYTVESKGIIEMSGFHCINANSMRLDRMFHGFPQKTNPPFEFSILDKDGHNAEYYEPGQIFRVRLVGYVHFRGLMLQSRLCDPQGYLIGSLRGGEFIINQLDDFGIGFQYCDSSLSNDSITHTNDNKKFLIEADWKTDIDIGAVQFMLTVVVEDTLYWERWRPRHGFIRPNYLKGVAVIDKLFTSEEIVDSNSEEFYTAPPFDSSAFEEMVASEENKLNKNNMKVESLVALQPGVPLFELESTTSLTTKNSDDGKITAVSQKLFKKFNPDAKDDLNSEDVKFLNSHAQLGQSDFVELEMDLEETCLQANPCDNNGVCTVANGKLRCDCPRGWVGERCQEKDACMNNSCVSNSTCENGLKGTYICKCMKDTVGTYCQFTCPPDLCSNKGECIMKTNGQIGCKCIPGTTGSRCEREIDECAYKKCKNSIECIDLFNDYHCQCKDGWMGKDCDRPCQDVYGSCRAWKREGQCELTRETTDFFESNCAASCQKCVFRNETIITDSPLPPVLIPLSWLLGVWQVHVKGFQNTAYDYPFDFNASGYNETLSFTVAKAVMFGTPSINFTSESISDDDPSDVHCHNGFMTIRQYSPNDDNSEKAALMTVNNVGVAFVEEGDILTVERSNGRHLNLIPVYMNVKEELKDKVPSKLARSFVRKGAKLMQLITKEEKGRMLKFSKIYNKIKEFPYL